MKKIICYLLSVQLLFSALATPTMAASDAYLADKTVYFDTTRIEDALATDSKLHWSHFTNDSNFTVKAGFTSVYDGGMNYYLREDAVKGEEYIAIANTAGGHFSRFSFAAPGDCVTGDHYVIEFSVKDSGTSGDMTFSGITDITGDTLDFVYSSATGLKTAGKVSGGNIFTDFVAGEWNHIVAEFIPGETTGTVKFYVNGVYRGAGTSGQYTIANFNSAWPNSRVQISGEFALDDFRMYKITGDYNPTTAGDVAMVTSTTLLVDGDKIKFAGKATLSQIRQKLTAAGNGTITFVSATDAEITNETIPAVTGTKAIVRAASGVTYKTYILEEASLVTSSTYTISNGVVRGITGETSISDFLAALDSTSALSIEDISGNPVTEGNLSMGMKLVATSSTGITRAEYDIDCANLSFTGPENYSVTKLATQEFEASFVGDGMVDFYVNGSVYETTTNTPHKITVSHNAPGNYTVYAKVTFAGGAVLETEHITYTYAPNRVPTVTLSGVTDGEEIAHTDTLTLSLSASDPDPTGSVVEKAIYIDGVKQVVTGAVTVGPFSLGSHEIYAEATDNEGGVGTTAIYRVNVVKKTKNVLYTNNYDGASNWMLAGAQYQLPETDETAQTYGNVFRISSDTGEQIYAQFDGTVFSIPNKGVLEMDLRLSNTSMKHYILMLRHDGVDAQDWNVYVSNGKLCGNAQATIEENRWYHYKIEWDVDKTKISVSVKPSGTSDDQYIKALTDATLNTNGAIGTFEMFYGREGTASPYIADIDNMEVYYLQESTYLKEVKYLGASGENVFINNEARYNLKKIEHHFNNEISAPSVTTDSIKVYANNILQTGYSVGADGKVITITFSGDIKTLSDYRIDYVGVKDSYNETVDIGSITFDTSAAEYDCLEWTIKKSDETVQSLNNIEKGDVLTLTAKLSNMSTQTKNSTLVFAVYSGNTLVGSCFTSVSLGIGQTLPFTSLPLTISDDANGDLKAFGYVWTDTTATRDIEIQRFIMTD